MVFMLAALDEHFQLACVATPIFSGEQVQFHLPKLGKIHTDHFQLSKILNFEIQQTGLLLAKNKKDLLADA